MGELLVSDPHGGCGSRRQQKIATIGSFFTFYFVRLEVTHDAKNMLEQEFDLILLCCQMCLFLTFSPENFFLIIKSEPGSGSARIQHALLDPDGAQCGFRIRIIL